MRPDFYDTDLDNMSGYGADVVTLYSPVATRSIKNQLSTYGVQYFNDRYFHVLYVKDEYLDTVFICGEGYDHYGSVYCNKELETYIKHLARR